MMMLLLLLLLLSSLHVARASPGIAFAKDAAVEFKVASAQAGAAVATAQAALVEFAAVLAVEIRALDAAVAGRAEAVVELVVVALAVGGIADDVEFAGEKGRATGRAHKARFVIAARQASVGG